MIKKVVQFVCFEEVNLKKYLYKLKGNISEKKIKKIQKQILDEKNFDYTTLILPEIGQEYWENCAIIICALDDDKIIPLIPKLLEWFKDLNWPGGMLILKRLDRISPTIMEPFFIETIDVAIKEEDYEWIYFLLYLENIYTKKIIDKMIECTKSADEFYKKEFSEWFRKLPETMKNDETKKYERN